MEINVGDADMLNIENLARLEKIPEDYLPLPNDIWDKVEQAYGSGNIGALFWEGSIPRGDFRPGSSDADFVAIIKSGIERGQASELQERLAELEPKWQNLGITRLDVFALSEDDIHKAQKQKSVFILATDAIQVLGDKSYDLSFAVPDTKLELVRLLNGGLCGHVDWAFSEDRISTNSRWISKMAMRAIYGIAMINGAKYERKMTEYRAGVEQYTPEYITLFDELCSAMNRTWTEQNIEHFHREITDIGERLDVMFSSSTYLAKDKSELMTSEVSI
ncbi:hypothetical protein KC867_02070 [Candidatus Saccharibacteria bacterium]|nr:hypothetical protein [Candidatus Saccharibacteria bacterium]